MTPYNKCKKIKISDLQKMGKIVDTSFTLEWSNSFLHTKKLENFVAIHVFKNSRQVEIGYISVSNSENRRIVYKIELTPISTHFGGFRYYFKCPIQCEDGKLCLKRISTLYKPENQSYFGCRTCHRVIYPTQQFNKKSNIYHSVQRQILEDKIKKVSTKIRSSYYKGIKTRKQNILEKLVDKITNYSEVI